MSQKKLSLAPTIAPSASVRDCVLGRYTEVGARTVLVETQMGDYSYVVNDANIISTTIGKFVSIAAMTRINPGNHPMHRATQAHFTYRASAYFDGAEDDAAFFDWRRSFPVSIGHDAWIGHGAIILPGRSIGIGAVVAAGAVADVAAADTARLAAEARTAAVLAELAGYEQKKTDLGVTLILRDLQFASASAVLGSGAQGRLAPLAAFLAKQAPPWCA